MSVSIDIALDVQEAYQKLRTSRTPFHSILLKANVDELQVQLVEEFADGIKLDDILTKIPSDEPRFIVQMPERVHPDGIRKSYPIVMIAYCPAGLPPNVNIVYTNARAALQRTFQIQFIQDVKKKFQIGDEELIECFNTNKW